MLRRKLVPVAVMALTATLAAGCAITTHDTVSATSLTTLIPGWERYFAVEWSAAPEAGGWRRLDGYIFNRYGEYAADVRLLVQAVDASGKVVDQRVVWGPAGVGGFGRAYFNVRNLPAADHYLVSVWDYRLIQGASLLR
jgi:hypothetical protein